MQIWNKTSKILESHSWGMPKSLTLPSVVSIIKNRRGFIRLYFRRQVHLVLEWKLNWTVIVVQLFHSVTKGQVSVIKICLSLTNIQLLILNKFGFSLEFNNCLCFQDSQCFVLAESSMSVMHFSLKMAALTYPCQCHKLLVFPAENRNKEA